VKPVVLALVRVLCFAAAAALMLAAVTVGTDREVPTGAYVAVLGAIGVAEGLRWLNRAAPIDEQPPSPLVVRAAPPGVLPRPVVLSDLEGVVHGAHRSARSVRIRFQPRLAELARIRLELRRGIDVRTEPDRSREALGSAAWLLERPPSPVPSSAEPGLTLAQVTATVEALEDL
jgi:hypothetical protein